MKTTSVDGRFDEYFKWNGWWRTSGVTFEQICYMNVWKII
jgi:hypothetical protein